MALDLNHRTVEGQLTDIQFDNDSQTRADLSFKTLPPEHAEEDPDEDEEEAEEFEGQEYDGFRTYRFALNQLLKFADMKKRDLKDPDSDDGVTHPNAREMVMDELGGRRFKFKYNDNVDNEVLSVVSPRYATIPSEEVDDLVTTKLSEMGIEEPQRIVRRRGFVVELDYRWDSEHEVESVGDTVDAGISVRNSAFGASSLRVDPYYTILACENGMRVKEGNGEVRYNHVGEESELREEFEQVLEASMENIWDSVDFIDRVGAIDMELEEQVEFVEQLGESGSITKTAAQHVSEELEEGEESEWNLGRENAWNVVNALTGYVSHADDIGTELSDSSIQRIERTYNKILRSEDEQDLVEMVQ